MDDFYPTPEFRDPSKTSIPEREKIPQNTVDPDVSMRHES